MMKNVGTSVALFAAVTFSGSALADTATEISTASDHAGYAVASANVAAIHMHLHHAVNCLVGPGAKEFDPGNENPCEKAGKGAIPDTGDAAAKSKLQAVVTMAEAGIASDDQATAKKHASDAYAALRAFK